MTSIGLQKKELANGSKLLFQKSEIDELVSINIFFPVGIDAEGDKKGIGSITAAMLLKGCEGVEKDVLAFLLEKNGMLLDWSRTYDYITYSLVLHKQVLREGLELFFDFLLNPTFPANELEILQKETLHDLQARQDSIFCAAYDIFLKNIFRDKNCPYSNLTIGDEDSIKSFSVDDLRKFHKTYFTPVNSVVTVLGNCEILDIENILEANFSVNSETVDTIKKFDFSPLEENIIIEERKKFNQSYIIYGLVSPSINDENHVPLKIVNEYLCGGMSSVLFDLIREKNGFVYEINSQFPVRKQNSFWMVYMGLDKKNIKNALGKLQEFLKNFYEKGMSVDELAKIKIKMESEYVLRHQTKSRRGSYYGFWETMGKGFEYDKQYLIDVKNTKLDDINKVLSFLKNAKTTTVIIESR